MDVINAFLVAVTIINFALAAVVAVRHSRGEPMNRLFSLVVSNIVLWSVVMILFRYVTNIAITDVLLRLLYAIPLFMPVLFLHFVYVYTGSTYIKHERFAVWALHAYTWVFAAITIFSSAVVYNPVAVPGMEKEFSFGSLYVWYVAHYLVFFPVAFITLWASIVQSTDKTFRQRSALMFVGVAVSATIGMVGNLLLPWFGIFTFDWTANAFTALYVCVIMYAIVRYSLFDLKVIATEFLAMLLMSVLIIELFFTKSQTEFYVKMSVLVLVFALITLLIRSVYREVEQRERIEQLSNEKSEFMTFASHEIRNPITRIQNYATLLLEGDAGTMDATAKGTVEKVIVSTHDVLSLITQFLNKSKLELGQLQYTIASFDLGALAAQTVGEFQPHASQRGLKLISRVDLSQDYCAAGDQQKTKEVLGILLDNSLKYTKEGSVSVSVETHDKHTLVVITDTGVGIPAETIPNLFKKFSRADAAKANLLGTGVGLYLAKTLIEGMGGRVWVESPGPGKGSTFFVQLPAAL